MVCIFTLHTHSEVFKRKFHETTSDVQQFNNTVYSMQFSTYKNGEFIILPINPLCPQAKRTRFEPSQKSCKMMHRQITEELFLFLQKHQGKSPAVYIHGPQGVGKSLSLYEVVCRLKADPKNRVIYLSDCADWGNSKDKSLAVGFLLHVIAMAFLEDEDVLDLCRSITEASDVAIVNLLEQIAHICNLKKLNLYAVFDQHNGLTPEQRKLFPWVLIENVLPSLGSWKSALVIIAASTNNEYQLHVANDWPQFVMNHGYTEQEFEAWAKHHNFFLDQDLSEVQYWTSRIPLELTLLLHAKGVCGPTATLDQVLTYYKQDRMRVLSAQQELFVKNHVQDELSQQFAIDAVVFMILGLRNTFCHVKLNQQLMFEDNSKIYPVTPLAQEVLLNFWSTKLQNALDSTTQKMFSSLDFSNDVKRRVLKKYIIRQLVHHKFLDLSLQHVNSIDRSKWETTSMHFKDLAVIHFAGNKGPSSADWSKPTLFVPCSPNYPGVDFLLWDPTKSTLWATQVAVVNPISDQGNEFFAQASFWKAACPTEIAVINFLWIGANEGVSFTQDYPQYVALMKDLPSLLSPCQMPEAIIAQ